MFSVLVCNNSFYSLDISHLYPSPHPPHHLFLSFFFFKTTNKSLHLLYSLQLFWFLMPTVSVLSASAPPPSFLVLCSLILLFSFCSIYILCFHCLVVLPAYFVSVAPPRPLPPFLPPSSVVPSFPPSSFSTLGVCLSRDDHRVPKRRLL